jgi:SAM-dependent methyltransferase
MVGSDVSERGLRLARQWLVREAIAPHLIRCDMAANPFPGGSFDVVISRGVISHGSRRKHLATVRELGRLLRPGGLVMVDFIATQDPLYGKGKRVAPETFNADDGPEAGILHYFVTDAVVERLMRPYFRVVSLHSWHHVWDHSGTEQYEWVYWGRKT